MEHIRNIEIKNFKSIRHQKIEDCRRINVFIGYPNVGKSNILEALGLFGVNSENIKKIIRLKEDPTIFFNGLIENTVSILINENRYTIEGTYKNNEFNLVAKFNEKEAITKLTNLKTDFLELYRYRFRSFNFSSFSDPNFEWKIDIPVVKKYDFKKEINFNAQNYSSLDYPHGENIFAVLNTNREVKKDVTDLLKEYELEFLYNTSDQKFSILKRIESGIFTVPYELIADTLQRLIFYKAAVATNKNSILLFEEPEAHMFPPYIRKLTADIMFDENDNQYFIATHSPYVLDAFVEDIPEELSVYLVDYKDGQTKIMYLTREDLQEVREYGVDLFFNIESYLRNGQIHNA